MGILVSLALLSALFFGVTVVIRTFVAMIGGAVPDRGPLRALAVAGRARLATVGLEREHRELLGR